MKKSWCMIDRIITGEKVIESRWYKTKHLPWGKIAAGDMIYFKNSGEMISAKAEVERVVSFADLSEVRVREIINEYGERDGIAEEDREKFIGLFKDKKYCLLIFLKNPEIIKPFVINKIGFGAMAAWISIPEIDEIRV